MKSLLEVYIYALVDPREGLPRYIGQTDSPERRLLQHKSLPEKEKNSYKGRWLIEMQVHGYQVYMLLLDRVPRAEGRRAEKEWIDHFRALGVKLFNQ